MNDEQAIISTADFFPPVVDDPYTFGQIAAANALSDVYAMGGEPLFALNLAGFPDNLDLDILSRIFLGGADKVQEAGAVIAGGHTVTDEEPKYGLSVTGQVHPDRIFTKAGAQPGDILVLTKPIGTGVITTAHKRDCVESAHLEEAVASMCRLNGGAARLLQQFTIHACTDVTGYGLLGHAMEMARHGNVRFEFAAQAIPLLNGALAYARDDVVPGGLDRNRDFLLDEGLLTLEADIPPALARTPLRSPDQRRSARRRTPAGSSPTRRGFPRRQRAALDHRLRERWQRDHRNVGIACDTNANARPSPGARLIGRPRHVAAISRPLRRPHTHSATRPDRYSAFRPAPGFGHGT